MTKRREDRLYIDRGDRDRYGKLDKEDVLKFKDRGGRRTRSEQFIFAMAYGFNKTARRKLKSVESFVLVKDLNDQQIGLINALAVFEAKTPDVLEDRGEVLTIAEEYAHGGILLLANAIDNNPHGSFEPLLEKEISKCIRK